MKKYEYVGVRGALTGQLMALGAALCMLSTLGGMAAIAGIVYLAFTGTDPGTLETLACLTILCVATGWNFGLAFANLYPTVWIGDEHLAISTILGTKVTIPWKDVIDIGHGHPPSGHTLVRARRITPAHRLYGWRFSHRFYPSFIIGPGLKDRDDLISEITWRAQRAHTTTEARHSDHTGGSGSE
jgi:hypothetical protein